MNPEQYCQDKAAKSGSSFYYSFLFLDQARRKGITALYAFCREVDDIVDDGKDPNIAAVKLTWWRQEIHRLYQGNPVHPVSQALQPFVLQREIPEQLFHDIIAGMEMDLHHQGFQNYHDLETYCYHAASVVGLLSLYMFGEQDDDTRRYAKHLGLALQLTNIIRDVKEDKLRGRIYLPAQAMQAQGISCDTLLTHANLPALLTEVAQRAEQHYQQAMAALPREQYVAQSAGLVMAAIYKKLLQKIKSQHFQVNKQRISLSPIHKLWIAWRTLRKIKGRGKNQKVILAT